MRASSFKIRFSKLLMQLPKVKVVAVVVAITMGDLKIRVIPLS
jgi:phosphatidate phosphatase PAH1